MPASHDTSYVSSVSLTPGQIGSETAGGDWTTRTLPFTWPSAETLGVYFDFSVSRDTENHILAPSIPFTKAADSVNGNSDEFYTLTLTTTDGPASGTATNNVLSVVNELNPGDFSDSNTILASTLVALSAGTWASSVVTYSLDFNIDYSSVEKPLVRLVNQATWDGKLYLTVTNATGGTLSLTAVTFAGLTNRWHTGAADRPQRRVRAVHDYKSGYPYWSDEALPDGYLEGKMVHQANWDPEDPGTEWVPMDSERRVDDEIDNIE